MSLIVRKTCHHKIGSVLHNGNRTSPMVVRCLGCDTITRTPVTWFMIRTVISIVDIKHNTIVTEGDLTAEYQWLSKRRRGRS